MKDKKRRRILVGILILIAVIAYFHFFRQAPIKSQDVTTAAQFLQYFDQKGEKNITWSDFDHLPHEKEDAEGHTITYQLKDGSTLHFSGDSMDQPPRDISLNLEKASIQPQEKEGKIEPKSIQTKEDVIRYLGQVGGDHVTWSDFDHLPHEKGGSGLYVVVYTLKDGSRLALSGTGEDQAPWFINLSLTSDKK
ncbi:hypothetical protein [Kallipyga massiliensis]|uniref:hypothetical protein n=1 Tax=Kallipyga massiliensis TaxID=1472764 RepID=UPI0004B0272E|nr:hypothetical protein [Kallipyga massiliensis]